MAELVMALARLEGNPISNLSQLKDKSLRHQNVETQRCLRLFCGCNQYVNTSMRRFLICAKANDGDDLSNTLKETVWHYSMPNDLSLWDQEHNVMCFEFQAMLLTLASEKGVILQPECGWQEDLNEKVSIVEDVSIMWGWQRDPCPETLQGTGTGQHHIREPVGMLPPYCVMKTTKQAVREILDIGAARVQKNFTTRLTGLFNREARISRSISDIWMHNAVKDLDHYLVTGHGNIAPTELPSRLWNVKTGLEAQETSDLARGTTYCAVSYVWDQWKNDTKSPHLPDLERIRTSLLEVAEATGIDLFWVDGNCIDQADEKDKARELPKMGQYYAGAAFTIVLLPDVKEPQKTPTPKPWQVFDAKAHWEANARLVKQYINCVWLKRIWTVQEAWLARKMVFKTGGAGGELIRGDYLELLRTIGPVIDKHGAVPVCLEWMNIGPTLVMGACTGDLITPGDTATLLTRPAGSLLQHNDGTGLQARTTTLQRALRLCYGRGCAPTKPSGKLIGLLGMVTGGDELTSSIMEEAEQEAVKSGAIAKNAPFLESRPEQAFKVAVNMRRLGPEIMLCETASAEPGFSWLPSLRDRGDGVRLPYIAEKVSRHPPSMRVGLNGAVVQALDAKLTKIVIGRRNTTATGQTGFTYSCSVKTKYGHKRKATIHSAAQVTTVTRWSKVPVLLLQRQLQSDPFICVRVRRRGGDHYTRRQGFLLIIEGDLQLEEECREGFRDRYIG